MFLHGHMGSRHRRVHKERGKDQERRLREKAEAQICPCHSLPPLGTEEDENFFIPPGNELFAQVSCITVCSAALGL